MASPGRAITMSIEELRRVYLVKQAMERVITQKRAAELLELSCRQTKRLVKRVKEEGEGGIIHRLRGRKGNRRIAEGVRVRVMRVYYEKYRGFGPTFASEKLLEHEGLAVDHETLRRWLREEGKWKWQRKGRKHRQWRQRKEQRGEMVQVDGSHHDWLEGRGPQLVLMGYVDDATGEVWARFYEYEGTMPALDSFMRYVRRYGVPQRIYLDKHTTYRSPKTQSIEEQLRGEEPMSQFERAMKELGVVVIHAHSPQAKGRIERVFGTFPTGSVWTGQSGEGDEISRDKEQGGGECVSGAISGEVQQKVQCRASEGRGSAQEGTEEGGAGEDTVYEGGEERTE
jgi:hypothetical protein